MKHIKGFRLATMAAVTAALLAACGDNAPKQQQAAPPPSVIVESVALHDLAEEQSFTGRIEAIDKVQIRARVQGYLKARNFEEGSEVKKDELLFQIEPEPFELTVTQATANLANAEAALTLAEQTYQRSLELTDRGTASKASLDSAQSSLRQAQANVKARQAELQTAQLNLSYTRIMAPMPGRIGRSAYSVGNLVGPDSGSLALLVKQDPVYVTFPVPYSLILRVKKGGRSEDAVYIKLRLADGTMYEPEGQIAFEDVQATSSTDAVTVRGIIANPNRLLIDQQLVSVFVIRKRPQKKLVVSQAALLLDQQGPYVLAIDDKNTVSISRITVGEQRGPLIVVESGLKPDQRVIVSGHQKVRPGAVVDPQTATKASSLPASATAKR